MPFSHCCGLVLAFACGRGACWACWGTFSGRAGRTFGAFGGFEAWQTAALNAYKKPLLRPGGALEPFLWPCGGFCLRAWRVLGLLGYLFPAELGGLLERLERLRPGKRQPWTPIRSHCCGRGVPLSHCCGLVVAFACGRGACGGLLGYLVPAELGGLLERLRPGKRQPWTPIRSHCCGRGVPLSHCCGLVVAFACGRGACWACWGTFSLPSWADFWRVWGLANGRLECLKEPIAAAGECPWAIAVALWWLLPAGVARVELVGVPFPAENAYKKPLLRPGGALQPLLWPCVGYCVRAWRVLGLLGYLFPAELGGLLERLERLRPGKRQPWTPIRSHCCGRGVPLSHCCGLVVALACGRGACWACWGTFSLPSWADVWSVWGLANGSLERL